MKTKVLKKKLTLNKKTVVNLEKQTMNKIYGGYSLAPTYCIRQCVFVLPGVYHPIPK